MDDVLELRINSCNVLKFSFDPISYRSSSQSFWLLPGQSWSENSSPANASTSGQCHGCGKISGTKPQGGEGGVSRYVWEGMLGLVCSGEGVVTDKFSFLHSIICLKDGYWDKNLYSWSQDVGIRNVQDTGWKNISTLFVPRCCTFLITSLKIKYETCTKL